MSWEKEDEKAIVFDNGSINTRFELFKIFNFILELDLPVMKSQNSHFQQFMENQRNLKINY